MASAAHLNVCHYCGHVLHPFVVFWVCGSPASLSFLQVTQQMDNTGMGCGGGGLCGNVVRSFFPNSMTTVIIILAAVIALIIGFGVSGM